MFSRCEEPLPTDPYAVPLDKINMADGRYFQQNRQFEFFKRLREEDPVHLNDHPFTGRYWSVTKFEDIMYIDKHHELFSSAHGIGIGPRIDAEPNPDELNVSMFIAMDPPKHDLQRATVTSVVALIIIHFVLCTWSLNGHCSVTGRFVLLRDCPGSCPA